MSDNFEERSATTHSTNSTFPCERDSEDFSTSEIIANLLVLKSRQQDMAHDAVRAVKKRTIEATLIVEEQEAIHTVL